MPRHPVLDDVLFHWQPPPFKGLEASPSSFFGALRDAVAQRRIPEVEYGTIEWYEGGPLSPKREYLRVSRGRLVFDICGAPFGAAFFVSWWLAPRRPSISPVFLFSLVIGISLATVGLSRTLGPMAIALVAVLTPLAVLAQATLGREGNPADDFIRSLPLIGWLYERWFFPDTYYRLDTAIVFQRVMHDAVLEVIDGLTKATGVRALSEEERKPIMRELFKRPRAA